MYAALLPANAAERLILSASDALNWLRTGTRLVLHRTRYAAVRALSRPR